MYEQQKIKPGNLIFILDEKNNIDAYSILYFVNNIESVTANGSIELNVVPVCMYRDALYNGETLSIDTNYRRSGNASTDAEFLQWNMADREIREYLTSYRHLLIKETFMDKCVYVATCDKDQIDKILTERKLSLMMYMDNHHNSDRTFHIVVLRGGENIVDKVEISEMLMNPSDALDFLKTYQDFSDSDVKEIYSMSNEELEYALRILRKRYDRKNPKFHTVRTN